MPLAVITGNRLRDGVVVWRAGDAWVEPFEQADRFEADAIEAALARAQADIQKQIVVGVYKAGIGLRDGRAVPDNVRETIRSHGPSVRLDLGIQASDTQAPHKQASHTQAPGTQAPGTQALDTQAMGHEAG